jgi:hypothetical protein
VTYSGSVVITRGRGRGGDRQNRARRPPRAILRGVWLGEGRSHRGGLQVALWASGPIGFLGLYRCAALNHAEAVRPAAVITDCVVCFRFTVAVDN